MLQYKQRKTPGHTIILHLCTNNLDVIYSSWDIERDRLKLIILGQFYLFYPLKPKKSKFWKNEELAGDIILHMCTKNQLYEVRFLKYGAQRTDFFVILDHLLLFYPPNNLQSQNFQEIKKASRATTILQVCTINGNHMMYASWDLVGERRNFLRLWTVFCPFNSLPTQKIKILKKWIKKPGDIIILRICTINDNHMTYASWDMERQTTRFLSFWTVFYPFPP